MAKLSLFLVSKELVLVQIRIETASNLKYATPFPLHFSAWAATFSFLAVPRERVLFATLRQLALLADGVVRNRERLNRS